MSDQQRLQFHQRQSGPKMDELKAWLTEQIDQHKVEPNSSLGEAISYMLKHWDKLTLFLREPGAPLDNNVCERVRTRRSKIVLVRLPREVYYVAWVWLICVPIRGCFTCRLPPIRSPGRLDAPELPEHAPKN